MTRELLPGSRVTNPVEGQSNFGKAKQEGAEMAESTKERPPGYVQFAAVMMAGIGFFALLSAMAGFTGSPWLQGGSLLGDVLDLVSFMFTALSLRCGCLFFAHSFALWYYII